MCTKTHHFPNCDRKTQTKLFLNCYRVFTSSLQLANTLNVEICGAQKGKLSNDTFQLKLLSKERYHEHLQNYQAPSEENLVNKLEKIKEIRMQNKVNNHQY